MTPPPQRDQKPAVRNVGNAESPASIIAGRPVLARDADATYWMARYTERSEHVARLLQVNSEALIDVGDLADELLERHWTSILRIMSSDPPASSGSDDEFDSLAVRIASHMTFNEANPNSLTRCLTRARENARGIREVISSDMWEHLNKLYWLMRSDEARTMFQEAPAQLWQQIVSGSMLFQGLTDQTLVHGQRWFFTQLGKYFERISVTCRILKVKHEILAGSDSAEAYTPLWNIHWSAVLRSCGSIEAYRRTYLNEIEPAHVAQFLVLDEYFPRSIYFSVSAAHDAIASIRKIVRPRSLDPTERVLGRLRAQLEYADPIEITGPNLSRYMDQVLDSIAEAALCVQRSYFLQ